MKNKGSQAYTDHRACVYVSVIAFPMTDARASEQTLAHSHTQFERAFGEKGHLLQQKVVSAAAVVAVVDVIAVIAVVAVVAVFAAVVAAAVIVVVLLLLL